MGAEAPPEQQELQQGTSTRVEASPAMSAGIRSQGSSQASRSSNDSSMECLGCRLTGLAFGLGGGGYILSSLLQDPPPRGANKAAVLASAGTLLCFGLYRAIS